ncbi:hypothetical protein QQX09_09035 [Demequina sp. SYSU T00192]|uniref:Exo-alpha-sialidase n=1 Tax=Demequina litoralis TaxID=3051660 RepID=A0ABT8GA39_9MICO|nr:hypothetical protein [Demequina sp. SYSU T00192]MDN4475998.1 hypothetical protein [Demequina sp. SYSU T00192]
MLTVGACTDGGSGDADETSSMASPLPVSRCSSLDGEGWSTSDDLREASGFEALALASSGDAVVALAAPAGFGYWSSDGLTWTRAEGKPELGGGCPLTVSGGAEGFVATGTTGATPVTAFSRDGRVWETVPASTWPAGDVEWFADVCAGDDGFIVAGATGDALGSFAWSSADGRAWSVTPLSPGQVFAATATAAGWLALTVSREPTDGDVAVWTSPDGQDWTHVDAASAPPADALLAYCGTAPLASGDGATVLAPTEGGDEHAIPDVTVWTSADDGAAWTENLVVDVSERGQFAVHDLAWTSVGFVLTGVVDDPGPSEDQASFISFSDDGSAWRTCWTTEELTEVEPLGDGLVLLDEESMLVHVWTGP